MHSATGIVYAKSAARRPRRHGRIFGRDSYQRRVTMMDDPAEVFGACLKRLGTSVNSGDRERVEGGARSGYQTKATVACLSERRSPRPGSSRRRAGSADVGPSGAGCHGQLAQLWLHVSARRVSRCTPITSAILRESKHQDLAYEFVNYLLRPEVAAAMQSRCERATANAQRGTFCPHSGTTTVLYPEPEVLQRGEWFRALPGAAQRLRDRYWTEIKSYPN